MGVGGRWEGQVAAPSLTILKDREDGAWLSLPPWPQAEEPEAEAQPPTSTPGSC